MAEPLDIEFTYNPASDVEFTYTPPDDIEFIKPPKRLPAERLARYGGEGLKLQPGQEPEELKLIKGLPAGIVSKLLETTRGALGRRPPGVAVVPGFIPMPVPISPEVRKVQEETEKRIMELPIKEKVAEIMQADPEGIHFKAGELVGSIAEVAALHKVSSGTVSALRNTLGGITKPLLEKVGAGEAITKLATPAGNLIERMVADFGLGTMVGIVEGKKPKGIILEGATWALIGGALGVPRFVIEQTRAVKGTAGKWVVEKVVEAGKRDAAIEAEKFAPDIKLTPPVERVTPEIHAEKLGFQKMEPPAGAIPVREQPILRMEPPVVKPTAPSVPPETLKPQPPKPFEPPKMMGFPPPPREPGMFPHKHYETLKESTLLSERVKEQLGGDYQRIANSDAWNEAVDRVSRDTEMAFMELSVDSLPSAVDTATAHALILKYQMDNLNDKAVAVARIITKRLTKYGQAIQAASILGRLSPVNTQRFYEKTIESARTSAQKGELKRILNKIDDGFKKVEQDAVKEASPKIDKIAKEVKKLTPEEMLARRISLGIKKKDDPVKDMVNTLYEVAQKYLPQRGVKVPRDEIEFVGEALNKKEQYREVWTEAQKLVREKYEKRYVDDPEKLTFVLNQLDSYFNAILGKPYHEKKIVKAVTQEIKAQKVSVSEVVKQHFSEEIRIRGSLSDALVRKAGVTPLEAEYLEGEIFNELEKVFSTRKREILESMFKDKKSPQKFLSQQIIEMSNLGAFGGKYRSAAGKRLGIPELNENTALLITKQVNKIQELPYGGERSAAIQDLFNIIDQAKLPAERAKELKHMFRQIRLRKPPKEFHEKIYQWSRAGAFEHPDYQDLVAQKLGIPHISLALSRDITRQARKIQTLAFGWERAKEIDKLYEMIDDARYVTFSQRFAGRNYLYQTWGLWKAIQSSFFDLSFIGRQGSFLAPSFPREWTKGAKQGAKALVNEKNADISMDALMKDAEFIAAERDGVKFYGMTSALAGHAEQFQSPIAQRIPGIGRVVKATERAYSVAANVDRLGYYKAYKNIYNKNAKWTNGISWEENETLRRNLATWINTATGHGTWKGAEQTVGLLNALLYAPRKVVGDAKTINPILSLNMLLNSRNDPFIRRMVLANQMRYLATGAAMLAAFKFAGCEVGLNYRSADFGKVVLPNGVRLDIWGGRAQWVVFMMRTLSGEFVSSTTGKTTILGEGFRPKTKETVALDFLRMKSNPSMAFAWDWYRQQDARGVPFNASKRALENFVPMTMGDAYDLMMIDPTLTPLAILSGLGMGVQVYGSERRTY